MKCTKTFFRVEWGGSGAFVVKNSDATSWHELLHHYYRFAPSFVTQPNGPNAPKLYEMHQNMSLGSNGVDRVRSSRNDSTQLRGTNFCTSSKCLAPSFVRQLNDPKCMQMVQNAPKHEFMVQWGGSGAFVAKSLCHLVSSEFFATNAPDPPHWTLNSCFVAFHTIWVHLGLLSCLTKFGTKRSELMQKFVPRSRVGVFRDERT